MSAYSITYRDGHKVAVPVNREEYLAIRDSSKNIANLQMARKGNDYAKRLLVQFNYSCYPNSDGTLKGATAPSATVAMDIDHVDDAKALGKRICDRAQELDIYMVERTAGGHGIHVVFKRVPSLNNEENIKLMAEKLGVEADTNAKDITRVLFSTTSSKNELYLLRDELFADNGAEPTSVKKEEKAEHSNVVVRDDYKGIPYSKIIATWWRLHYNGETPTQSNRNTQTYELALNLRHICGYSEAQLRHIIPCYDGFSETERNECIKSAVATRKTLMPKKMSDVLSAIRQENINDVELLTELENTMFDEDQMRTNQLPALPIGLRETVDQAASGLAFPAIFALGSIIGFLATNVRVKCRGVMKGLSIQTFIVGESGSGKGVATRIFETWLEFMQEQIDEMYKKEKQWAIKNAAKQSGTRDADPQYRIRIIPFNNTSAQMCERLDAVQGEHSISYASEADTVFGKWKGDMETLSSMMRTAWDEDRYDREAKSVDAARCHIKHLKWNTILAGTPDALYRLVSNVTDGFMNRLCIARTPDNTFMPLELEAEVGFSDTQRDIVQFVAECLTLMHGDIKDERMEQWNLEWTETLRIDALKAGADRVLARMRMRTPTTAQRLMCATYVLCKCIELMLDEYGDKATVIKRLRANPYIWMDYLDSAVCEDARQFYMTVCDYMVDTFMFYFEDDLREQYADKKYNQAVERKSKKTGISLFDGLPHEFCADDICEYMAVHEKKTIARGTAFNILTTWKKDRLVVNGSKRGYYAKNDAQNNNDEEDE